MASALSVGKEETIPKPPNRTLRTEPDTNPADQARCETYCLRQAGVQGRYLMPLSWSGGQGRTRLSNHRRAFLENQMCFFITNGRVCFRRALTLCPY